MGGDKIGSDGAQHFATMLRENEVEIIIFSSFVALIDLSLYQQTLITLDIVGGQIEDAGVQHLATALQDNKVKIVIFS